MSKKPPPANANYIGICIVFGLSIGGIVGVIVGNVVVGVVVGVVFGTMVGMNLATMARNAK